VWLPLASRRVTTPFPLNRGQTPVQVRADVRVAAEVTTPFPLNRGQTVVFTGVDELPHGVTTPFPLNRGQRRIANLLVPEPEGHNTFLIEVKHVFPQGAAGLIC